MRISKWNSPSLNAAVFMLGHAATIRTDDDLYNFRAMNRQLSVAHCENGYTMDVRNFLIRKALAYYNAANPDCPKNSPYTDWEYVFAW